MTRNKSKKKEFNFGQDVQVVFVNNETKGAPISFNFQGRGFGPLEDGKEYDLPAAVINHLNTRVTPRMEYATDDATGQRISRQIGVQRRFTCNESKGLPVHNVKAPAKENIAGGTGENKNGNRTQEEGSPSVQP